MIYFDNAATMGKKPETVVEAVRNSLYWFSANPGRSGHALSLKAAEKVYEAREKIARLFGCENAENVIFTGNCTQSINTVLKGVLSKGDHVVISSQEHNAVMRPLVKLRNPYTLANISLEDNQETLNSFEKAIKPHTRLVFCTAASNVTGRILPIEKIGEMCNKRRILFGVDAAQLGGICPIDMRRMNIDFLCLAPHKGLFAPMGIGVLIARKPIDKTIIEGGTGSFSADFLQPEALPEKFESGTLNLSGCMGVSAGIDFLNQVGMEKLYNHEIGLIKKLYFGLSKNPKVTLYTPMPKHGEYVAVLPFNLKGKTSEETAVFLDEKGVAVRGGLHCAPLAHRQIGTLKSGAVRVSLSPFNTEKEIESFLEIMS